MDIEMKTETEKQITEEVLKGISGASVFNSTNPFSFAQLKKAITLTIQKVKQYYVKKYQTKF